MHAATPVPEGRALPARLPSSGPQYSCETKKNNSHGYAKSRLTPGSQRAPKHRPPAKYNKPTPGRHTGMQHGQPRTPAAQFPLELEMPFEMQKAEKSPEKSAINTTGKGVAQFSGIKMSSPARLERQKDFFRGVSRTPEPPSPIKATSSHSSLQWSRGCLDKDKNSTSQSGLKLSYAAAAANGAAHLLTPAHSQGFLFGTPGTGCSSHSSTRSKDSSQSSSSKKAETPPVVRKFRDDPGFFKQRLPLSDSEDSDTNAGGQKLSAEPLKGSQLAQYPSRNSPPRKSPPRSLTFERNASKLPPSCQRTNGAHPKQHLQQLQQQPSKSLSVARTYAPTKPPQAPHARQSSRQRHPSQCCLKPSAASEKKEAAIAENAGAPVVQAVPADDKCGMAVAEDHKGTGSSQSDAGQVPPDSQNRSLLSLLQDPDPHAGNHYTEINGRRYQLLDLIGKGGSSKVFMMFTHRKKLCAVKLVSMAGVQPMVVETYMNEVAILKSLRDCERVVSLYDYEYVRKDQVLALVMEKGDQDLANVLTAAIKKGLLNPVSVKFYWYEMLQAVLEIHEKGVIHSDLKPANFLFADGKLKLIDFGIASTTQADVTSVLKESPMGTFNFMSPESLQLVVHEAGKHCLKISRKSDVWSLGCILYHLVYGKTPFQHIRATEAKLAAIVGESYVIEFPEVSDPNLLDVLKKCLRRNPIQRPTISELLEHPYLAEERARQRNPVLQSVLTDIENLSPASVLKLSKVVKYLRGHKK